MIRRVAIPTAAVLAALGLALVARGAFAVDRSLGTASDAHGVGAGVASNLTGAQTHREVRDALALLERRGGTVAQRLARFRQAAILLARPASHGDARAANLLGIISAEEAVAVKEHAAESFAAARDEFEAAIRADPAGEDAKHNLELLLAERSQQRQQRSKRGGDVRKTGTGHSPPGSGY